MRFPCFARSIQNKRLNNVCFPSSLFSWLSLAKWFIFYCRCYVCCRDTRLGRIVNNIQITWLGLEIWILKQQAETELCWAQCNLLYGRFNLRLTYPPPIMGSSQGNSAPKPHKTVLRHVYRILFSGGSILWMLQISCTLEFTFLIKRLQFSFPDNILFTIVPSLSYLPFYLLTFTVLSSCLF